jgi:hypothetical protein
MSRYPGGLIRKTPVTPAGPFQNGAAPGMWTLAEASFWTKQGLWPIAGNLAPVVEDAFSTWLYTGNGSTQTITNGINLSGQGGMVWIKARSSAQSNIVFDTNRGVENRLVTNADIAQSTLSGSLTAFNSNGFALGNFASTNDSGVTYASWTFRQEPKFFDVVTYTGNGVADREIAHNLGVMPGFVVIKRTDNTGNWYVAAYNGTNAFLRSSAATDFGLNLTNAALSSVGSSNNFFNATSVNLNGMLADVDASPAQRDKVNANGATYVAYLFAHNTASDGFIQCGSFTTNGSGQATVTLGWEPQWTLIKASSTTSQWQTRDIMRGMSMTGSNILYPNLSAAEDATSSEIQPTATGFFVTGNGHPANQTFIYVAIRRGPMRTPTLGTSVFSPTKQTSTGYTQITGINFAPDFVFQKAPSDGGDGWNAVDKLRGPSASLAFNTTGAEVVDTQFFLGGFLNSGVKMGTASNGQFNGYNPNSLLFFQRAPGFMDVVCYTGTGVATTQAHNLGAVPELMIVKKRSGGDWWAVYAASIGAANYLRLETTGVPVSASSVWNATAPTSTVFSIGDAFVTNQSSSTYVAYLFASAPGVSKVGSYTGNGSSQTINCAFTTGARFVLIKRTDSTGDWYVWDSARGIVAGNDPYLALNSTAAEVTTNDSVDTDSTGFVVNQVAASNINVNAATYIFLAIA